MELYFLLIAFAFYSPSLTDLTSSSWIIWNVGQGEWVTHMESNSCRHFDMGGEHWPKSAIAKACGQKRNSVYFSHWDLDHVGFAQKAQSVLPNLCLGKAPLGETSKRKKWLLQEIKPCVPPTITLSEAKGLSKDLQIWIPPLPRNQKKSSNERSQIYIDQKMLVTGDAPAKEEQTFAQSTQREIKNVLWLVLGHHGSRTSTSDFLLRSLPRLRLAIASARRAKYGHPHSEILRRLRFHRIPVLSTEDWGNIEIQE